MGAGGGGEAQGRDSKMAKGKLWGQVTSSPTRWPGQVPSPPWASSPAVVMCPPCARGCDNDKMLTELLAKGPTMFVRHEKEVWTPAMGAEGRAATCPATERGGQPEEPWGTR